MLRPGAFVRRSLNWGACGLAVIVAATAISSDADARGRHHRHRAAPATAERYEPATASIVVDANTGAVMQATNADSPRHPASLTKIMTLYLLFERLEAGKIKMSTDMPVSLHAAAQAPSKLGLKPGETIGVETAIRAIVTKSANDVAVIVAEALAGDEAEFAKQMTAKARALGMMHTSYYNASGLPEERQWTTARDQAILARAIHDRFPKYYGYFATRTFAFRGKTMRNHNHLLGQVAGVDGIKTGYIHDSGFNIVTSARRGNRYIVAAVFGGRTARARDARVTALIENNINIASANRTAPPMVEGLAVAEARAKEVQEIKDAASKPKVASFALLAPAAALAPAAQPAPQREEPAIGSTDPIKPNSVKTITVQLNNMQTASLSAPSPDSRKLTPATAASTSVTNVPVVRREPVEPAAARTDTVVLSQNTKVASTSASLPIAAAEHAAKSRGNGPWMIQVGAFDDEKDAKQRLAAAQEKARNQLGQAEQFTERVAKGDKALYRARFAGLDKEQAEVACKHLKRSEIPCMLLKN
jgi:D-alanyl-D-alanine carboxypeptidase